MAIRAVVPLLVAALAIGSIAGCRRRLAAPARVATLGPVTSRGPNLSTRFLETRSVTGGPPDVAPDLKNVPLSPSSARREGGVPEVVNVANDCSVHAVWWTTHLFGMTAKGSANWVATSGMPNVPENVSTTRSASRMRIMPWSTKTQVRRSPIQRVLLDVLPIGANLPGILSSQGAAG